MDKAPADNGLIAKVVKSFLPETSHVFCLRLRSVVSSLCVFACFVFFSPSLTVQPAPAFSQAVGVLVDGYFSDWDPVAPLCADSVGDVAFGSVDFGRLWVTNDERFLHLSIEVGKQINLQNDNEVVLFLDTDDEPGTGVGVDGIGAELGWFFGRRTGFFVSGSDSSSISQSDIHIVTAPTITSTRFEIAIDRRARPVGQRPLFLNNTIKIAFADVADGDQIPDPSGSISYTFDVASHAPSSSLSLQRRHENHLRILTYNVLHDGIFDPARSQYFSRILKAIRPDVIGFQEVYKHGAEEAVALAERVLPLAGQEQWFGSKALPDIIVISRHPIVDVYPIGESGAFLIDLRPRHDADVLLVVAHPPCCHHNAERQLEIDALMAFVRDAKSPGGALDLQLGTPIIIMGDMNLVGYGEQLETLVKGTILNTDVHGKPFAPDWDGTDFADLMPRHTHLPMTFTWYDEKDTFSPGRLDFIIYSDSVIDPGNRFVLFTPEMPTGTLASYGLTPQDVVKASDHLPVVADFVLHPSHPIHPR